MRTAATIRQAYVDNLEAEFAQGKRLIRHAAPELVEAAEIKLRGEAIDPALFKRAAAELLGQPDGERIDTVVLACTHFPLVQQELAAAFGREIAFVDGSAGIARRIAHLTQGQPFMRTKPDYAVFTGGPVDPAILPALVHFGLEQAEIF